VKWALLLSAITSTFVAAASCDGEPVERCMPPRPECGAERIGSCSQYDVDPGCEDVLTDLVCDDNGDLWRVPCPAGTICVADDDDVAWSDSNWCR
jgi:hypothetical protein